MNCVVYASFLVEMVPTEDFMLPIGKAEVVKEGIETINGAFSVFKEMM